MTKKSLNPIQYGLFLTLSGSAFSVVCQAPGGGGAQRPGMPKIKVNIKLIEIKLCMGHYIYKSIPGAKFEVNSSFSFGNMTSPNFPQMKGTSHPIRLFTPRKLD